MRAIVCESYTSPAHLKVHETDAPEPARDEVLLNVAATGLGYVDALTVAGLYQIKPTLPFIPGNEIAGVVERTGADVRHLQAGQRVLAMPSSGGLAEKACLPADRCTPIPDTLSFDAAASFVVNYCTAYHGLTHCGKLATGETILILGGSGGVGLAAIDTAKAMGATVIAAASTGAKRNACLDAGADHAIDYTGDNWRGAVQEALAGRSLDLVYDPVGGNYAEPALRSLGPGGRFLVVGFASGDIPRIPINLVLLKRCSIVGVNWGGHNAANPSASGMVLDTLLQWIAEGKITPTAGESFALEDAGVAMMKMLDRQAIGKVVIHPDR